MNHPNTCDDDGEAVTHLFFGDAPTTPEVRDVGRAPLLPPSHSRIDDLAQLGRMAAQAGRYADAWSFLQRVSQLQRAEGVAPGERARTHCELAVVAIRRGDHEQGRNHLKAAAALAPDIHPSVLHNLGFLARSDGDLSAAESLYADALTLKICVGGWRQPSVAATLSAQGQLQVLRKQPAAALRSLLPARHIYEVCGSAVSSGMAFTLMGMGRAYLQLQMHEHARAAFERALAVREALTVPPDQLACTRYYLALAIWPDRPDEAQALIRTALDEYRRHPCAEHRYIRVLESWITNRSN